MPISLRSKVERKVCLKNFYFLKTLSDNRFTGDNFPIDYCLYFNLVLSLNVSQGSFPVVRILQARAGGEPGGAIVGRQQETDVDP